MNADENETIAIYSDSSKVNALELYLLPLQPERYILAAVSVDVPEFPPTKNIIRGKVRRFGCNVDDK